MKKKYILDIMIVVLAIICIVTILNTVRATSDTQTEENKVEKSNSEQIIVTTSGTKGDADGNNVIEIADESIVLKYIANQELYFKKPTEDELKIADIDNDGIITYEDAVYILKYYALNGAGIENVTWDKAIQEVKNEMQSSEN